MNASVSDRTIALKNIQVCPPYQIGQHTGKHLIRVTPVKKQAWCFMVKALDITKKALMNKN